MSEPSTGPDEMPAPLDGPHGGAHRAGGGPLDSADAGAGVTGADFGALRLGYLPPGVTPRLLDGPGGAGYAVALQLPAGQLSLSVLAAPRSARLWPGMAATIAAAQGAEGPVLTETGEWGPQVQSGSHGELTWFMGADGPGWLLYGVASGPAEHSRELAEALRAVMRGAVVDRGTEPYPPRTALPLVRPPAATSADPAAADPTASSDEPPAVLAPVPDRAVPAGPGPAGASAAPVAGGAAWHPSYHGAPRRPVEPGRHVAGGDGSTAPHTPGATAAGGGTAVNRGDVPESGGAAAGVLGAAAIAGAAADGGSGSSGPDTSSSDRNDPGPADHSGGDGTPRHLRNDPSTPALRPMPGPARHSTTRPAGHTPPRRDEWPQWLDDPFDDRSAGRHAAAPDTPPASDPPTGTGSARPHLHDADHHRYGAASHPHDAESAQAGPPGAPTAIDRVAAERTAAVADGAAAKEARLARTNRRLVAVAAALVLLVGAGSVIMLTRGTRPVRPGPVVSSQPAPATALTTADPNPSGISPGTPGLPQPGPAGTVPNIAQPGPAGTPANPAQPGPAGTPANPAQPGPAGTPANPAQPGPNVGGSGRAAVPAPASGPGPAPVAVPGPGAHAPPAHGGSGNPRGHTGTRPAPTAHRPATPAPPAAHASRSPHATGPDDHGARSGDDRSDHGDDTDDNGGSEDRTPAHRRHHPDDRTQPSPDVLRRLGELLQGLDGVG